MVICKTAENYSLSQWVGIIRRREESGLNVKEYCKQAGITRYQYYYWLRKVNARNPEEVSMDSEKTAEFAELKAFKYTEGLKSGSLPAGDDKGIEIRIGRASISIGNKIPAELLRTVMEVIRDAQ